MTIGHAYSTAVHDPETGLTGEVATIAVDAIAEEHFAELLRRNRPEAFLNELANNVEGQQLRVLPIDPRVLFPNNQGLSEGNLKVLLTGALTGSWDAAAESLRRQVRPTEGVDRFIQQLLEAVVLAEHSDPAAAKAAAQIGATAMPAAGAVGVALVAHGAALGVVIVGTGGVAAIGVGAAALIYGLLNWRKRR